MAYEKLTTVADVRGWLRTNSTNDDALLGSLIDSLSAQVGRLLGRDNLGSIEAYVENYRVPTAGPSAQSRILLRHYPIVTLSSVGCAGQSTPIITDPMSAVVSGAWVEDDRRTLSFYGNSLVAGGGLPLCQVSYAAGYAPDDVPPGLKHAVNQWVGEIVRSQDWIGYTSKSLAGESVSFEQGRQWGMSKRTKEMLEPYRDRVPWSGVA